MTAKPISIKCTGGKPCGCPGGMGNIWNRHEAAQALMQSFADLMRSDLRSGTRPHALIPPPIIRIAAPLPRN
jgi:hypothetical protein